MRQRLMQEFYDGGSADTTWTWISSFLKKDNSFIEK